MATTIAECDPQAGYGWSFNSLQQSPCQIASFLGGACGNGEFTVGPLASGRVYLGPSAAQVQGSSECLCSGVFYNLVSACAGCQNDHWLSWPSYNSNCTTVFPTLFPLNIPSETKVPHWAYLDPTNNINTTFDPAVANQTNVLTVPESTAPPQSSGTASSPGPTSASSKSSSKAGPIAGGVVGGIVGLGLIAALVFLWTRRHRSRTKPSADYASVAPLSPPPMSFATAPSSFSATMPSQRLYDPSDPSTYPAPVQAPTTDYTGSSQVFQNHTTGSTIPAGRYTGAPEV